MASRAIRRADVLCLKMRACCDAYLADDQQQDMLVGSNAGATPFVFSVSCQCLELSGTRGGLSGGHPSANARSA
jgi:hypothetical protein